MKTIYAVLLALVLIVGGAKVLSGQDVIDEKGFSSVQEVPFGHAEAHHPDSGKFRRSI